MMSTHYASCRGILPTPNDYAGAAKRMLRVRPAIIVTTRRSDQLIYRCRRLDVQHAGDGQDETHVQLGQFGDRHLGFGEICDDLPSRDLTEARDSRDPGVCETPQ
jgi:hypothetical protein